MATNGAGHVETENYCAIKVHSLMCLELRKLIERASMIYSALDFSRPRCNSGIQLLCSLLASIEKGNLLIQHCSESSKLYLAITADKILSRCKNIRHTLISCLAQIQSDVPTLLAAQIARVIEDLRNAKLRLKTPEVEAGNAVRSLLKRDVPASEPTNDLELEALRFAALRLKITSPLAVLIERRSISKLANKVHGKDPTKKKILSYLLYLLRKYGKLISQSQTDHPSIDPQPLVESPRDKIESDDLSFYELPEELQCPISKRLMYDPVIISSGKTYERFWIERWFGEGNKTCPVTHAVLENLYVTPNLVMQSLISKLCSDKGITVSDPSGVSVPAVDSRSIASFGSSIRKLNLQVSRVSLHSTDENFGLHPVEDDNDEAASGCSISIASLSELDSLPWESRCNLVRDVKEKLNKIEEELEELFPSSFMGQLIKFLQDARDLHDANALADSAQLILTVLEQSRIEIPPFSEESFYVLASLLDSEIKMLALSILEQLSCQRFYKSAIVASGVLPLILKVLEIDGCELHALTIKILCNLSCNSDIAYHIVYLDSISKLVPFLSDRSLAGYCLNIFNNLCDIDEGKHAVAEDTLCVLSIAKLLQSGSKKEQEIALEVLLSICYEHSDCYLLIMGDSIVQCLFSIQADGSSGGKVCATDLLKLLGHIADETASNSTTRSSSHDSNNSGFHREGKKSPYKAFRDLQGKIVRFVRKRHR